jgi:micrococcal nuclease
MYEYNCKIVRVIDGDTVDVDIDLGFDVCLKKQRIRLFGVDTPESRTRDVVEKKFGIMAKNFVKGRLPIGSDQILRTRLEDSRGKFGRILGEFVMEDSTLNIILVSTNNAVSYFGQSKEEVEAGHLENRRILEAQRNLGE